MGDEVRVNSEGIEQAANDLDAAKERIRVTLEQLGQDDRKGHGPSDVEKDAPGTPEERAASKA